MVFCRCVRVAVLFLALLCWASDTRAQQKTYVYKDYDTPGTIGVWANLMPENAPDMIVFNTQYGVHKDYEKPHEGKTSVQIDVQLLPPWWCGLVVSSADQYWGVEDRPEARYDLSWAKKLVFWARGEQGGESIQVKVAITGGKPYGDSSKFPFTTGWIKLDKDWKPYELPVDGNALREVVTPFSVVVNKSYNPSGRLTFYLDDIYFG